jgi:WD40 repeat protein
MRRITSWAIVLVALVATSAAAQAAPDDAPKADGWGPVTKLGTADGLLFAISPDGNEIVTHPYAPKVRSVLDLRTANVRRVEGEFGSHLGAIAYSPDGKLIACAEWNNGATIRDAKTWKILDHITPSGKNPVSMAAFTPDGKQVAFYCWSWRGGFIPPNPAQPITHYDYQLMLWDVAGKKELGWPAAAQVGPALTNFHQGMFTGRPYLFTREDISDDKGWSVSKTFTLTDITTNKTTRPIALDKDDDKLFDVTPDGKQILAMTAGQDPRLVDVATGKSGRSFGGHVRLITAAALSRDGKRVVTASGRRVDGSTAAKLKGGWPPDVGPTELRIHDVATGEVIAAYRDDKLFDFTYVGFSPDGKFVWGQTADYQLMLWGRFPAMPENATVNWPADPKQPGPFQPGGGPRVRPDAVPVLPVSDALDKLVESLPKSGRTIDQQIDALYLAALGRFPTAAEQKKVAPLLGDKPTAERWKSVLDRLVQSPEFEAHVKTLQKRSPPATPAPFGWRPDQPRFAPSPLGWPPWDPNYVPPKKP